MNSNIGGLASLGMDSTALPNQRQGISSTQRKLLSKSEIESLQKDKRESYKKLDEIFDRLQSVK